MEPEAIARNQGTIQNIRLWDVRPLLQTYQQTHALRLYYQVNHVDVDRYHLADGYHQVSLRLANSQPTFLPTRARGSMNTCNLRTATAS